MTIWCWNMVLETAMNDRAGGIVTSNRRDFEPATRRFGVAVLSPGDAVIDLSDGIALIWGHLINGESIARHRSDVFRHRPNEPFSA